MSLREAAEMHTLKTDPEAFQAVIAGRKTYEIRFDDRGFKVGDRLNLLETASTGAEMKAGAPLEYTGGQFWAKVTHILRGPVYGLAEGWVILSIVEDMAGSFNPDEMRAELAKPDAPAAAPDCDVMPQAFADYIKRNYCGEVVFSDPMWHAVRIWRAAMAAATRPAPAEPQTERDLAAEVDHWMKRSKAWRMRAETAEFAVSEFHHAVKDAGWHPGRTDDSLPDIIRAKGAELRATPAPQPAGGPVAWQRSDVNIVTGEWSVWRHDDYPHEDLDPKRAMRRPLYAHGITATKGER